MATTTARETGTWTVSAALFLCLFAAQAAVITMSPVLADAASDLGVSTATAGQLRSVTGISAGVTALLIGLVAQRVGLGLQLLGGAALLAVGSVASAVAPTYATLAIAQVPVGVGVACLTTGGTVAAAEWVAPAQRTRVLSRTLVGQPAAWIVGMPVIGLVGESSWRYGWLLLPLAASIVAAALVAPRVGSRPARARPGSTRVALASPAIASWLASELFANAAWAGTLVYSGALFTEAFGAGARLTGCLLAGAAVAYVVGNVAHRRLVRSEPRRLLILLAVVLAATAALFGSVSAGIVTNTVVLWCAAFVAGGRTLISSAFALSTPAEVRATVTGIRVATMQFGYLIGSVAGGVALALGGYGAIGPTMAGLFLAAAATLVHRGSRTARRPADGTVGAAPARATV